MKQKSTVLSSQFAVGLVILCLCLTAMPRVQAQYNYSLNYQTNTISGVKPDIVSPRFNSWIAGNGKWEIAGNWSSGFAPTNTDFVVITNAGNNTVTIDATTVLSNAISGCLTVNTLTVSAPSGSTNTLALNNTGTLSTPLLIGSVGTLGGGGVITVTNSVLEVDMTGGGPAGVDAVLVGVVGSGNTLAITNGGALYDNYGILGSNSTSSGNSVLVGGPGSVWSNRSDLYVGLYGASNQLIVTNGGQVVTSNGYLGIWGSSSNNVALVTGSVWSNRIVLEVGWMGAGNQLTIATGGQVVNGSSGYLGVQPSSSNNVALVTGPGSVWSNGNNLTVGDYGPINQLTVANGGRIVVNGSSYLGSETGSSNNIALVTGPDSVWSNGNSLYVGYFGANNQLTVTSSGQVFNGYGYVGRASSSSNNVTLVTDPGSIWSNRNDLYVGCSGEGNQLTVTNGGTVFANDLVLGQYSGGSGTLTLAGGAVNITSLIVTNAGSTVVFNSGTLNTAGAAITNALTFAVGDGLDAATYHLLGGTHSFASGLEILNNASLTGCGTVTGNVVVDFGGTVQVDCGTLSFTTNVTNNGTMRVSSGSVLEAYGLVVNNGLIDITAGTTNFHGGFINNGVVCSQLISNTISTISSPVDSGTTSGGGSEACGEIVTVTATPSSCNRFVNWTEAGTNVSASASYTFMASVDRTLVANFTSITYTITTTNFPPYGGTTSGGGSVPCGSNVTVCATANPGYAFLSWSGVSKSNCYTFVPNGNAILGAIFGPFRMIGLTVQSNNVRLTWMAPHGWTNVVMAAKGGAGGGYSPTNFVPISLPPIVMPLGDPTSGVVTNYLDVGGATNKPARYYRVWLLP